jgi:formyl transferase family protein
MRKYTVLFMARGVASAIRALQALIDRREFLVSAAILHPSATILRRLCSRYGIPIIEETEALRFFRGEGASLDYIFSFYWKRIGEEILSLPTKAAINFHPGPLPEARGSGYHVAILEDWGYWGVTAHYMDAEFDTGRIIQCDRFPISSTIVNEELVHLAHQKLATLFLEILEHIVEGTLPQGEVQGEGRYFSLASMEEAKVILPSDSSEMIERKIRAFWHPPFIGAKMILQGREYALVDPETIKKIARQGRDAPPSMEHLD